jgi:putative copper resistance protein D
MSTLLVAARAIHFASVILVFGELVFVLFIAWPVWHDRNEAGEDQVIHRRLLDVVFWSAVLSIASGAAWLAAEAASMSGLPMEKAISPNTLGLVLGRTVFGRLWILRFVLVVALCLLLVATHRSIDGKRTLPLELSALALAAVYLASLAWAGHAAAGSERIVQICSDIVHLLAAGAWLGALPGLVFLLDRARPLSTAAHTTQRFSVVGMVCVAALISSGFINAWFLVGSVPALIGTTYGQLLLAKLGLVLLMVSLAAVNRLNLTPRLQNNDPEARRQLRRNAALETVVGIGVVAIVGALGVTVPGAHQPPLWPFDYTLSWEPAEDSAVVRWAFVAGIAMACLAVAYGLWGARTRRPRVSIAAIVGIVVAIAVTGGLLAVPAYPTTYLNSPVRYDSAAVATGAALYRDNCVSCHGPHGYGDGPAASALPVKPANLVEHASHHPAGDLFWWIGHGIEGTPMPAFAPRLTATAIWELIQYLRALSDAEDARSMIDRVEPWRPIVAPDFTFESQAHGQESLKQQRGNHFTLLVLYTLPESLARLEELSAKAQAFADAGVRVIAVPTSISAPIARQITNGDESMFPIASPEVATAYAMFAGRDPGLQDVSPTHVEFLIDRQGYMRARWTGTHAATIDRTAEILGEVEQLKREPPRPPAPEGHMH